MKAVDRAMQIWRIVIRSRDGVGAQEVSAITGLCVRTTQRYLKSLIEVGAIYRKGHKYHGYY